MSSAINMSNVIIREKPRRELRRGLPPLPTTMRRLPIDSRGFPVPYFVTWFNEAGRPVRDGQGEPDFRCVNPEKIERCTRSSLCWICGSPMGAYKTFAVGPMCAVNRVSAEPPSHRSCAQFAARTCPFLTKPKMRRNEHSLPTGTCEAPGIALKRNPGVTLLWTTHNFSPFNAGNGTLFRIGPATSVEWYAEGREATRSEVLAAFESGLPALEKACDEEPTARGREAARAQLRMQIVAAMGLVPAEEAS